MTRLIVGLGNPGPRYERTRHNLGFALLDLLLRQAPSKGSWSDWRGLGLVCRLAEAGREVLLAKPATFMNESGRLVRPLAEAEGIGPPEVLVCFDDLSLKAGALRMRLKGSAGGHKGMRSVLDALGTQEVPRLRLGIGPLPPEADATDFVLRPFSRPELKSVEDALSRAAEAVWTALEAGLDRAMDRCNVSLTP